MGYLGGGGEPKTTVANWEPSLDKRMAGELDTSYDGMEASDDECVMVGGESA